MNFDFSKKADEIINKIFDFCEEKNIESDILNEILYIDASFGQYVVNKHNPTSQLWLSSPKSGAYKFNYNISENNWINNNQNNKVEIFDLIKSELK